MIVTAPKLCRGLHRNLGSGGLQPNGIEANLGHQQRLRQRAAQRSPTRGRGTCNRHRLPDRRRSDAVDEHDPVVRTRVEAALEPVRLWSAGSAIRYAAKAWVGRERLSAGSFGWLMVSENRLRKSGRLGCKQPQVRTETPYRESPSGPGGECLATARTSWSRRTRGRLPHSSFLVEERVALLVQLPGGRESLGAVPRFRAMRNPSSSEPPGNATASVELTCTGPGYPQSGRSMRTGGRASEAPMNSPRFGRVVILSPRQSGRCDAPCTSVLRSLVYVLMG